jgi:hypothetical protein
MDQSTVRIKVVECESEPDVPDTVMVDVTGCFWFPPPLPEPPPLQLVKRLRPTTLTASSKRTCKRRCFLQPKRKVTARAAGRDKFKLGR